MANITVVAGNYDTSGIIPRSRQVKVVRKLSLEALEQSRNIFVLSSATQLHEVSDFVRLANQRHHLRALFVRDDSNIYCLPQILAQANIRILRNLLVHSGPEIPRRVLTAWQLGAQKQLIANATVSNSHLLIITCAMEAVEIPLSTVYGIRNLSELDRKSFQIAEDGSYLYWPVGDVHIDLETLMAAVDPTLRAKKELSRLIHDQNIGVAVAALRKKYQLRQSDIPGLSERHVRRIENGESATLDAFTHFAKAIGKDVDAYLDELSRCAAALAPPGP